MYGEAGNDLLLAGDNERDALDGGSGFDTAQRDQSNRAVDLVLNIESFV
jgi:adenylylsulfate kinase-like enzyme